MSLSDGDTVAALLVTMEAAFLPAGMLAVVVMEAGMAVMSSMVVVVMKVKAGMVVLAVVVAMVGCLPTTTYRHSTCRWQRARQGTRGW